MAKKLNVGRLPSATKKYPWKQWGDGNVWELYRGEDYDVADEAMRRAAYSYGKSRGVRVATSLHPGGIRVHFIRSKKKLRIRKPA